MKNKDINYQYKKNIVIEFLKDLNQKYSIHGYVGYKNYPILLDFQTILQFLAIAEENHAIMLILQLKRDSTITYHHFLVFLSEKWYEIDCDLEATQELGFVDYIVDPSPYRLPDLLSEKLKNCLEVTAFEPPKQGH